MTTRDWQNFLETQRRLHAKTVFTATELANVAGVSLHALNVEVARLVHRGVVVRYARGKYGLPDAVPLDELVSAIDAHAYITGTYALYRHNLVTQVPTEIVCFTDRRHNRSRIRSTPLGRLTFVCVAPRIYSPPRDSALAGPERSLYDFAYLCGRRGIDPRSMVTLRRIERLKAREMKRLAKQYPASVVRRVRQLLVPVASGY